jgi:hypothetical protein
VAREGSAEAIPLDSGKPGETTTSTGPTAKQIEVKRHEAAQKATDDLEDCRTSAQNRYDTKMNIITSMTLAPMTRVAASNRLKLNLDSEIRQCRSQYELRVKAID